MHEELVVAANGRNIEGGIKAPSLAGGGSPEIQARDKALALPQLAFVTVVLFLRDLDGGVVALRFDPLSGFDLVHPIEAI